MGPQKNQLIFRFYDQYQWNQEARIENSMVEFFLNPPEGVGETFRAPEIKNGLHFDFSNFFKLETCKNLYKIFLVKLILMMGLIFLLDLHYKKATFEILYVYIVKGVLDSV